MVLAKAYKKRIIGTHSTQCHRASFLTCLEAMENRWDRIATLVTGGETPAQIKERYEELLHDISLINSGHRHDLTEELAAAEEMTAATKVDGGTMEHTPAVDGDIRTAWTEEEHRYWFFFPPFMFAFALY